MSIAIANLRDVPTHAWLFALLIVLLVCYYARADAMTYESFHAVLAAFLLSLQTTHKPATAP